jgi:hypothetical protein
MPKSATEIGSILGDMREQMRSEFMRLSLLDRKIKGDLTRVWMPDGADSEYRDLFKKAKGPWLEFTRDAIAQGIRVDGCNSDQVWAQWQANGMDGRQGGIQRETVGLGKSWLLVTPAGQHVEVEDEDGNPVRVVVADRSKVVIRPLSTLSTYAEFIDPYDEHPMWSLTRIGPKKADFWESKWLFVDDEAVYRFTGTIGSPQNLSTFEHELDYCPVSRVSNTLPTEGEPESSVSRAIPIYQRIVDATFTLEMVQRYGAFPQKYMAGGQIGTNSDGTPAARSSVDSLLHSTDPETRFGNFAAASLADVVVAVDAHIKHLAAVCQVPPHYLLGAVVNMSAEGIAAAESGYFRNIGERQDAMSEGYELAMRTVADILGIEGADIQMRFEDVSSRSLAQISDAITKLAMLKVPLDKLFAMIPGFTQLDATAAAASANAAKQAELDAGQSGGGVDATEQLAKQADSLGTMIRAGVAPDEAARRAGLDGLKFISGRPITIVEPSANTPAPALTP